MSTSTDGLSNIEILRLCVLELRGLRKDLAEAGALTPRPTQLYGVVRVEGDEEARDDA